MRPGTLLRWYALKNILKSEIDKCSTVLDIGSYDGFISHNLMKLVPNLSVIVVDIDKAGLQLAKQKGLNTLHASAFELPIESNRFDSVVCLDLIEHVKEDNKLINEISRVLKKDGNVILTTPMQNGISFPFMSEEEIEAVNKGWGHFRKGYSLKDIEKLFENSNLMVVKRSKYFNFLSRLIYWFNYLSGIPLKGKGLLYQLVIRLEPYIKYGAKEHIIIGRKVEP